MSTEKSSRLLHDDSLSRLAHAASAGAESGQALEALGLPEPAWASFVSEAAAVLQRAQSRVPKPSALETELALGVLLVLRRAAALHQVRQ